MITKAGTKRVVFCHTDVCWTTVHHSHETNLEKIEEEVIAKSFEELPMSETEWEVIDLAKEKTI